MKNLKYINLWLPASTFLWNFLKNYNFTNKIVTSTPKITIFTIKFFPLFLRILPPNFISNLETTYILWSLYFEVNIKFCFSRIRPLTVTPQEYTIWPNFMWINYGERQTIHTRNVCFHNIRKLWNDMIANWIRQLNTVIKKRTIFCDWKENQ